MFSETFPAAPVSVKRQFSPAITPRQFLPVFVVDYERLPYPEAASTNSLEI